MFTGDQPVRQFPLPAETVCHIWLPPRLSAISCFLPRLLCLENSYLQRLSEWFSFLPRVSAGSRITRTVSAGSHFSWTVVSAGRKRSQTVSAEAKYDRQSLQEAKISWLVYTLWCLHLMSFFLNSPWKAILWPFIGRVTLFRPDTPFGVLCKVQTQFRCRKMGCLIMINTVYLQEFLCKIQFKWKHPPQTPKTRNGLIQMMRMDSSTGQKWVNALLIQLEWVQ